MGSEQFNGLTDDGITRGLRYHFGVLKRLERHYRSVPECQALSLVDAKATGLILTLRYHGKALRCKLARRERDLLQNRRFRVLEIT